MGKAKHNHVFLSYAEDNLDFVEAVAQRLQGDARLSFWFVPWHSVPGEPIQEQMEVALRQAQARAVFVSAPGGLAGRKNEQMRAAIQTRVEAAPAGYRVIPCG